MNRANHFETRTPSRYAGEGPMAERIDALSDTRHHILGSLIAPVLMAGEKPIVPTVTPIDATKEAALAIEGNLANQAKAQELAAGVNTFTQDQILQQLRKAIPGYDNMVRQQSQVLQQQLRGEIPEDVQKAIQRNSASRNIYGGFGRGSGVGQNLEARDLGLTSLQITDRALQNSSAFINSVKQTATGPLFNIASMFVSPAERINLAQYNQQTQLGLDWAQSQINAAPDPLSYAYGQGLLNVESQIMSVAGSVAGAYTGGMMGGGGGNSNAGGLGGGGNDPFASKWGLSSKNNSSNYPEFGNSPY